MRNLNELRKNINAVNETRQITNAMYLLSATEAKKIMPTVEYTRTYIQKLRSSIKDILTRLGDVEHPYLSFKHRGKQAIIVIASDKGLCGSYNSNVLKAALPILECMENPFTCVVGGFARRMLESKGYVPSVEWIGPSQHPTMHYARQIAEYFSNMYRNKQIKELYIVYTKYSSANPTATALRLLPLSLEDFEDVEPVDNNRYELMYEPNPEFAFEHIVPQYLVGVIYACLQQSAASEHVCRMTAMQTATDNADEMLTKLNTEYSGIRQTQITNEISETVAGRL